MKRSEIKKYFRVWLTLIKRDLIAGLMYRLDFWSDTSSTLVWTAVQLVFLDIVFNFTDWLAGWNIWQIMVIFCFQQLSFYLVYMFLNPSLRQFADQIRRGDFDWIITKPIDPQFFTATQRFSFSVIISFFAIFGLLIYALIKVPNDIFWSNLLFGAVLFFCSLMITFSILYIFASLTFVFIRADSLSQIYYQSNAMSLYPRNLFHGPLKYFLSTLWPFLLLFALPAEAMLGIFDWPWILAFFFLTALFVLGSRKLWQTMIKYYSSASS